MVKINVAGIKKVTVKGRTYYYHRRTRKRLTAQFGTPEFLAEVRTLDGLPPTTGKTLLGLMTAYKASPEYTGLAERTKADYQKVFDHLSDAWQMPATVMSAPLILGLRDDANERRGRRFANYVVAVMSLLSTWGDVRGWCKRVDRVPKIKRPRDARTVNRPWADNELTNVLEAAKGGIKLAVALSAYTGLREGDVIRLPWSAYDGHSIAVRQGKTGDLVWIPAHSRLKAILDSAERVSPIIVTGVKGAPFTSSGFRAVFFKLIRNLKADGKVGDGLTFHGLRHTVATRLAEAGCDDQAIASITGHRTAAMVRRYTETVSNKKRATAAIKRLERNRNRTKVGKLDGKLGAR